MSRDLFDIENEPHFQPGRIYAQDSGDPPLSSGSPSAVTHEHSVFDEPSAAVHALAQTPRGAHHQCAGCQHDLAGTLPGTPCPACGLVSFVGPSDPMRMGSRQYLDTKRGQTSAAVSWGAIVGVALASGPLSVIGTLTNGLGGGIIGPFVTGPAIEEVMKIGLAAVLVETRPWLIRSRLQIHLMALLSALVFAAIENVLYIHVYLDHPSPELIHWRWTVCVMLHVLCTQISALGLSRVWHKSLQQGQFPGWRLMAPFILAGIVTHALYNISVTVLELLGGFTF